MMMSETMIDEEVLQFLKSMEFKKALFGVDKRDVLEKMRKLNNMYARKLDKAKRTASEAVAAANKQNEIEKKEVQRPPVNPLLTNESTAFNATDYDKRLSALARVLANSQNQADEIVLNAKKQADEIVADAVKKADEIEKESRIHAEQFRLRCRQEVETLQKQKEETIEYLKILQLFIGSYLEEDPNNNSKTINYAGNQVDNDIDEIHIETA